MIPDVATRDRFRQLYDEHWADIAAYARRRLPDADAADLAAEVFLVAWRRIDAVPDGAAGRLWLFGVARRVHANHQRARRRRDRLNLALVEVFTQQRSEVSAPESLEAVSAMSSLSAKDQELLRLAAWEGLRPAEIAAVLGCSVNAATIRLHRARQRLAAVLRRESERSAGERTCRAEEGRPR